MSNGLGQRIGPLGGILKQNNAGRLAAGTTGGNDLLHTMPTGRTARIVKIMAYNPGGANALLQFGTLDRNPAGAAFVQLLPIFVAIAGLDNEWLETEIPFVEFASDTTPTVAGRTGDIYVLEAGALAVDVILEIEEFGA